MGRPPRLHLVLMLPLLALAALLAACGGKDADETHEAPHWDYEGTGGPEHWADLQEGFAACGTGHQQSPIDIDGPSKGPVPTLAMNYKPTKLNILNNGHTIQVNCDAGSVLEVDGKPFDLLQLHFHTPSEHTVQGKAFDLEMHLVHKNAAGKLAVLGVLLEQGGGGEALRSIWAHLPAQEQKATTVPGVTLDLLALLPRERSVYTYAGSLTTPPCTEGVHWLLPCTPVAISTEQAQAFRAIFAHNARPVQPLNERRVTTN